MHFDPNTHGRKQFNMFEEEPESSGWISFILVVLILGATRFVMVLTGITFIRIPIIDPLIGRLAHTVRELIG
ncbi:hypothetical protein OAO01_00020 [Oligoflexia bacterium]|nr:hypothetical protein [Oligoflexia bacterium]